VALILSSECDGVFLLLSFLTAAVVNRDIGTQYTRMRLHGIRGLSFEDWELSAVAYSNKWGFAYSPWEGIPFLMPQPSSVCLWYWMGLVDKAVSWRRFIASLLSCPLDHVMLSGVIRYTTDNGHSCQLEAPVVARFV